MEQYMLQSVDAKEQAVLSELLEAIQENKKEIKEDFIKSKISLISSYSVCYALYEKICELTPESDIALWVCIKIYKWII